MSTLPPNPDLAFERKQAKALLRACRAGEAAALARLHAVLPRAGTAGPTLADAQHVIARERGFESWPKLMARIEASQPIHGQAEKFLQAVREDRPRVAHRLLGAHPPLAAFDVFTACAAGAADVAARMIAADPDAVTRTHGPEAWPPLAYACRSPLHAVSAQHADGLRRVAATLLDAGASPDSFSLWRSPEGPSLPIPVLYHACMSDHLALVELLLRRGANPNDGESVYHAAQYGRIACLERLLAHGADLSSRQGPYGNTPLYFLAGHASDEGGRAKWLEGFTWLLEHGADPNVTSGAAGETPLHGVAAGAPKPETVRVLLAHGADVHARRGDGRTAHAIAVRHGHTAMAALLREHGAGNDLPPMDAFLGACLAADGAGARSLLAEHPGLFESMGEAERAAMSDAVRHDRADAIRLMVHLGFRLEWEDVGGGTPLHTAAWLGKAEIVRLLIGLGAPLDVRDRTYGSSPLGWAAHGSAAHPDDDGRYVSIVDALIDAGAPREAVDNRWGERIGGSRAVARRLKERGFA